MSLSNIHLSVFALLMTAMLVLQGIANGEITFTAGSGNYTIASNVQYCSNRTTYFYSVCLNNCDGSTASAYDSNTCTGWFSSQAEAVAAYQSQGVSAGHSIVDNFTFSHIHDALEYHVADAGGDCKSCSGGSPFSSVEQLHLKRIHRYRDMTEDFSSFGPGVYTNYDLSIKIIESGTGYKTLIFDPTYRGLVRLWDGDNGDTTEDGIYNDTMTKSIHSMTLYDAPLGAGNIVSNPNQAQSAKLRTFTGGNIFFDMIDGEASLASGNWQKGDVGGVNVYGKTSYYQGSYLMDGAGANIGGTGDEFQYCFKPIVGDATIIASVNSITQPNGLNDGTPDPWAKVGVMIRETMASNSKMATVYLTPENGAEFMRRTSTGASATVSSSSSPEAPYYVKLVRSGNTLTGSISGNGITYTQLNSVTVTMASNVFVGLVTCSHSDDYLASAVFDNVTLTGTLGNHSPANASYHEDEIGVTGRVVRIEDRNQHAITISYKSSFTATEIKESYARQFQFDTITDANGRDLNFTYKSSQVSGRWVIETITQPNGGVITYSYDATNGYLDQVDYPDATQSTFDISYNSSNQTTLVAYNDAGAFGTHRTKTVYLTSPFDSNTGEEIFNQSSMLCRMILNGTGEVSYLNAYSDDLKSTYIYEGAGKLMLIQEGNVMFATDADVGPGKGVDAFDVNAWESNHLQKTENGTTNEKSNKRRRSIPDNTVSQTGVDIDYTFISGNNLVSQKTYSDATTEKFTYNAFDQLVRYKDRLNRVTRYTYDAKGNETKKEVGILYSGGADVNQTEYASYTKEYYPKTAADATGAVSTEFTGLLHFEYDAKGYRKEYVYYSSTDASGNPGNMTRLLKQIMEPDDTGSNYHIAASYTYDSSGRLATSADALGRTVTFTYDNRNRVVQKTYIDGSTESYIYGTGTNANLIVKSKDRKNNVTKFDFDGHGRLTTETLAYSSANTEINSGNLQLVNEVQNTSQLQFVTTYAYLDGTTLPVTIVRGGDMETRTYDYRHRLATSTKHVNSTTALTTTYTYIDNKLFKKTDPYGRNTYYNYRSSDAALTKIIEETIPDGAGSISGYADVVSKGRDVPAAGESHDYLITEYTLDAEGQRTSITDPNGNVTSMTYDSRGRVTDRYEADGETIETRTQTKYDANSNVIAVNSPRYFDSSDTLGYLSANVEYQYNQRNLQSSMIVAQTTGESARPTQTMTYYADGAANIITSFSGNTTKQFWTKCCNKDGGQQDQTGHGVLQNNNSYGLVTHIIGAANIAYSMVGNFTTITNLTSYPSADVVNETTIRYDARHRKIAETRWLVPLSSTISGSVDKNNPPIAGGGTSADSEVDASEGLTTTWEYDDHINDGQGLDTILTNLKTKMTISFSANVDGSAVVMTNPDGEKSASIMDGMGRTVVQGIIDPITSNAITWTATTYNDNFGVGENFFRTDTTDADSDVTKRYVDGAGFLRKVVDAINEETNYQYDANGNQLKVTDASTNYETCTYDELNRKITCADKQEVTESTSRSYTYDSNNNVKTFTDAKGNVVSMTYDARDRLEQKNNRINSKVTNVYDGNGNLKAVVDGQGNRTNYEFDSRGLKTKTTYPDSGVITFTYDAGRRLKITTDQLSATITRYYDLTNRLTSRVYSDSTTDTFEYDLASRLTDATKGRYNNKVEMTYDNAGRKLTESITVHLAGVGGTERTYDTENTFDEDNTITQIKYHDNNIVYQTYTDRKELDDINYNSDNIANFDYDDAGRMALLTHGNDLTTDFEFTRADNMKSGITVKSSGVEVTALSFDLTYDKNKNIKTDITGGVMSSNTNWRANFDNENRLTNWSRFSVSSTNTLYGLSKEGDFNSVAIVSGSNQLRTHNAVHEVTAFGSNTLTYDDKGNLTEAKNGDDYTWDIDNMLASAVVSGNTTNFQYDALGRRVMKETGGTETVYVHSGQQVMSEYNQSGTLQRNYVYGPYVDQPVAYIEGGNRYYYHINYQYSVIGITNQSKTIIDLANYNAYGERQLYNTDGTTKSTATSGNPYWYTGRTLDTETNLHYFRARYYDDEMGRFINRDPLNWDSKSQRRVNQSQYHDGMNLYAGYFVPNNMDPSGMVQWLDLLVATVQTAGGAFMFDTGVAISGTLIGAAIGVPLATWGGLEVANGVRNMAAAITDQPTVTPYQVQIINRITDSSYDQTSLVVGYHSVNLVCGCVSIASSMTTVAHQTRNLSSELVETADGIITTIRSNYTLTATLRTAGVTQVLFDFSSFFFEVRETYEDVNNPPPIPIPPQSESTPNPTP